MEPIVKELLDFFREKLPRYLLDILDFASAPKSFLRRQTGTRYNFGQALTFLVLSLLLVNCLLLPTLPKDFFDISHVLAFFSHTVVFVTLHLFVILISWKLVGSSPSTKQVVVVYSYVAGIGFFFQGFWAWGCLLVLRLYPEAELLSNEIKNASDDRIFEIYASHPELLEAGLLIIAVFAIYMLTDLCWWLLTWGAFRRIAHAGWWRSTAAFLISYTLGWALFVFSFMFLTIIAP